MEYHIIRFDSVESTNLLAQEAGKQGKSHKTVIMAQEQTLGRGRRGRTWLSPKGDGLWFSILLYPDLPTHKAPMLSLVAGLAVCGGLKKACGLNTQIKWPNDIISKGKKLCGILTEMTLEKGAVKYVVVGIGINLHIKEFPAELAGLATSLDIETGACVNREELLLAILGEFDRYYEIFSKTGDLSLLEGQYNECLINKDHIVRVLDPEGEYEAKALGIDHTGALLVEKDGIQLSLDAGEVSVRGVYGYV